MFQADHCRVLAAECRDLALAARSRVEKALLTDLAGCWSRLANQTDRHVEFRKMQSGEKRGRLRWQKYGIR
jgi:hypothetical protein